MSAKDGRLRIGFIPLTDATALLIAVDKGFTAEEGLDVELVREVSWSNVRDKLNIGLFDAAHLIAPVAIASTVAATSWTRRIEAPRWTAINAAAIEPARRSSTLRPVIAPSMLLRDRPAITG